MVVTTVVAVVRVDVVNCVTVTVGVEVTVLVAVAVVVIGKTTV
jgi:hypothetical protein